MQNSFHVCLDLFMSTSIFIITFVIQVSLILCFPSLLFMATLFAPLFFFLLAIMIYVSGFVTTYCRQIEWERSERWSF